MNGPTFQHLSSLLKSHGFEEHPHVVPDNPKLSHFGYHIPYVFYCCRKTGKLHEYVSLTFYPDFAGEFCEGHYEFFYAPKNTYLPKGRTKTSELVKKGFKELVGALFRSEADMLSLVANTSDERVMQADKALKELEKQKD